MRNSAYTKPQIWNIHATEFLNIFIKVRKIALQSFKMSTTKKKILKKTGPSYD